MINFNLKAIIGKKIDYDCVKTLSGGCGKGKYIIKSIKKLDADSYRVNVFCEKCKKKDRFSSISQKQLFGLLLVKPVISNLPLAIIVVNKDRRVKLANKAAKIISGKSRSEMLNLRGGEILGCIYADNDKGGCGYGEKCEICEIRNTVITAFEQQTSKTLSDTNLILKDIGKRDLKISATYINLDTIQQEIIESERRENTGRRQSDLDKELVILSIEDITEFKQKEKLATVVETVGAACHELNNPLQSVVGNLDLIRMKLDKHELTDENLLKSINTIYSASTRMTDIISRLMNLKEYKTKDYLKDKILDVGDPTKK